MSEGKETASTIGASLRDGLRRHEAAITLLQGDPLKRLEDLVRLVDRTLAGGGAILACGNGGSATDAQHLVGELVGRYCEERRPLAGLALNADGAVLTCLANDYEYARVFARQVEANGRTGDLLVVISTSGRSPNIVEALHAARRKGLASAALLGRDGGAARGLATLEIIVPDRETARIQECHGLMIHLLCEALDRLLKEREGK